MHVEMETRHAQHISFIFCQFSWFWAVVVPGLGLLGARAAKLFAGPFYHCFEASLPSGVSLEAFSVFYGGGYALNWPRFMKRSI